MDNKLEMIAEIKEKYDIDIEPEDSWTTEELTEQFSIESFLAPFCFGKDKETGEDVSFTFIHMPRLYYNKR